MPNKSTQGERTPLQTTPSEVIPPSPIMVSLVSSSFNSSAVLNLNNASQLGQKAASGLAASAHGGPGVLTEVGDYALSLRTHTSRTSNAKLADNLAGALSYSEAQSASLKGMSEILGDMAELVVKMQDPLKSSADLNNYMLQFNGLRQSLVAARKETFGDMPLHDRTGTSIPLEVSLDGTSSNVLQLTQSNFIAEGAGALLALLGSSTQNLETKKKATIQDTTGFGDEDPVSDPVDLNTAAPVTGLEGYGTDATNTPQALVNWGVAPLEKLLSSVASLLTVNGVQQQRLMDAIDAARNRDLDLESAESKVSDSDVAHHLLDLAKSRMRTSAGTSAMAQANASADTVAKALYGGAGAGITWYQPPSA